MGADVGDPAGAGVADQQPQHSVPARQRADGRPLSSCHPVGDELHQPLAVGAQHPERAVLRAHEVAGRAGDPAQHLRQLEVGADGDDGVEELAEAVVAGLGDDGPRAQLGEEVVELEVAEPRAAGDGGPSGGGQRRRGW